MKKLIFVSVLVLVLSFAAAIYKFYYMSNDLVLPWNMSALENKALNGDGSAIKKLYHHYHAISGRGGEANEWLRKGAYLGLPEIQYMYATTLKTSNSPQSICWYGRSAVGGYQPSTYIVAQYYLSQGKDSEYIKWLSVAASNGHVHSMLDLANIIMKDKDSSEEKKSQALLMYKLVMNNTKKGSVYYVQAKDALDKMSLSIKNQATEVNAIKIDKSIITREMGEEINKLCKSVGERN